MIMIAITCFASSVYSCNKGYPKHSVATSALLALAAEHKNAAESTVLHLESVYLLLPPVLRNSLPEAGRSVVRKTPGQVSDVVLLCAGKGVHPLQVDSSISTMPLAFTSWQI